MKKSNILRLILCSLFFLICFPGASSAGHPAGVIMEFYADDLKDRDTIEPYLVSMLALNEVEHARNLHQVKQFILWYFNRLNYPDRHGLTGTIYITILEGGRERPAYKYDSVDGYAGLFLHLLHQYVLKTGDIEIVQKNWDKIEDIAYLIPVLQDSDGLTRSLPDNKVKYLMDNCEAYGGVAAYISLRSFAGKGPSVYYSEIRDSIKRGIFAQLYTPEDSLFAWATENNYMSRSSWNRYYPDAYAQLFPIYYDLLTDRPEVRDRLWLGFTEKYAGIARTLPVEQRIFYELTKKKMEEALRR